MQNLRLKAKIIIKSKKAITMQNSNQTLGNKFDNLYFHAKSWVKRKKIKIKCSTSLKRSGHADSKIGNLDEI